MQFAILGPLEARRDGRSVALGGAKPRSVLATLLLDANEPVSADRLAVALWGEDAPPGATRTVQVHVSRLRAALGDPRVLLTTAAGYVLSVGPGELDADAFADRVRQGQQALEGGEFEHAASAMREALALWRGPALADLALESFAQSAIARLEEQRLSALEARIEADLALGRHGELVGELQSLVAGHPVRERFHAQLMLALYRDGRQADALEAYRRARHMLVEEIGLEPGPALRELERAILDQDPGLAGFQERARRVAVPVPPAAIVGRAAELETIVDLLGTCRLLTVAGPGGVGKSRLAIEAAGAVARRFRDGADFIALAPVAAAEHVAIAIARHLGVSTRGDEGVEDALARALAAREALLVLDNFEHVLGAAPLVGALLAAAPGLAVLATSREPLRLRGERVFELEPLAPESSAVELLYALAGAAGRPLEHDERERAAAVEICRRLDGLPLAIELAAAGLGLLSIRELAAHLGSGAGALGTAPRDAPARHRTVTDAVAWSHRLLAPDERRAFAALSVFAGGGTIAAARDVTGASLGTLAELVGKHLARRSGGRLEMLETIRTFAAARLAEREDSDGAHRRHAEHFAAFARRLQPELDRRGSSEPLAQVDREIHNIRAALRWALGSAPGLALELASAISDYWVVLRETGEGAAWLASALAHADDDISPELRARALEAYAANAKEDPATIGQAEAAALEALDVRRAAGDLAGAARTATQLASISMHANRVAEAYGRAEGALELARAAGERVAEHRALATMAKTAPSLPEALRLAEEAAAAHRAEGAAWDLVALAVTLVYTALYHDEPIEAERLSRDGLEAARAHGDTGLVIAAHHNAGYAALFCGHADRARELFSLMRELAPDGDDSRTHSLALAGLAAAAAANGEDAAAARLLGAAGHRSLSEHEPSIAARIEERFLAPARARLGEREWQAAYDSGRLTRAGRPAPTAG